MDDSTFRNYLKELKKTPQKIKELSPRKQLFSSIVFAIIALALPVTILLTNQTQDVRQRASGDISSRGRIVNPNHSGQKIYSTLWFVGPSNPNFVNLYTATPVSEDWNTESIKTEVRKMKGVGINAVQISYWGHSGESEAWAPAISNPQAMSEAISAIEQEGLLFFPLVEVHPSNKFWEDFPANLDNLTERIVWFLNSYGGSSSWMEVYDKNQNKRKVVSLIETIHGSEIDPKVFSAGFRELSKRVKERTGYDIGFAIDPTPLPPGGSYFGPDLSMLLEEESVVLIMPYNVTSDGNSEEERIKSAIETFQKWDDFPLVTWVIAGFDDSKVRSPSQVYGKTEAWKKVQIDLARQYSTGGVLIGPWNGWTEWHHITNSNEIGDSNLNWAKEVISAVPREKINTTSPSSNGHKTFEFIMLAADKSQLYYYQNLNNSSVNVSYRTVNFSPEAEIDLFEEKGWKYYVTVASSDFVAYQNQENPYNYNIEQLESISQKPGFEGFYLHELMTYRAAVNNWDWNIARDTVDWGYLDNVFAIAQSKGKKVIWSEPTYAWKTMYESDAVNGKFALWKNSLVPMYANNFTREETASALEFAKLISERYGTPLGMSHQGWYWRDTHTNSIPTKEASYEQAMEGKNAGVTYYQFEGAPEDFLWDSPYMLGISEFTNSLANPIASPTITDGLVCAADVQVCPDGSYVSRVAPSCEFEACPEVGTGGVELPTLTPVPTSTPVSPTNTPTSTPTPIPQVFNGFKAEYFTNRNLSGEPSVIRDEATINYNWGTSAPLPNFQSDIFSVRWTKKEYFEEGKYIFSVRNDDGMRVYINGIRYYNRWFDQGSRTRSFIVQLSRGEHEIKVEYYENGGLAAAQLDWRKYTSTLRR